LDTAVNKAWATHPRWAGTSAEGREPERKEVELIVGLLQQWRRIEPLTMPPLRIRLQQTRTQLILAARTGYDDGACS